MRRNFKSLTTLFLLMLSVQCRDSCRVSFEIINQTSHIIKIIAPEKIMHFSDGKTIIIEPKLSWFDGSYGLGGEANYDEVPTFDGFDSLTVVFNGTDTVMHYRDSLKGNYQRSLFNIDAYDLNNCAYKFTFTEDDYSNAQK